MTIAIPGCNTLGADGHRAHRQKEDCGDDETENHTRMRPNPMVKRRAGLQTQPKTENGNSHDEQANRDERILLYHDEPPTSFLQNDVLGELSRDVPLSRLLWRVLAVSYSFVQQLERPKSAREESGRSRSWFSRMRSRPNYLAALLNSLVSICV
jgi:hypothetical protein